MLKINKQCETLTQLLEGWHTVLLIVVIREGGVLALQIIQGYCAQGEGRQVHGH